MPSTRRSQVSGTSHMRDDNDEQTKPSTTPSPKISRSRQHLPSRDEVDLESAARAAKRPKTASPSPTEVTKVQEIGTSTPESQAQDDQDQRQHRADGETEKDGDEMLHQNEQEGMNDKDAPPTAVPETDREASLDPSPPQWKTLDSSKLENLADRILNFHTNLTPEEFGSAIKTPESGKQYLQLQMGFDAAKDNGSGPKSFLSPIDLGSMDSKNIEICRRVNLATFVSSLFNGGVGLEEMDLYFLFLFVPKGGSLSKLAGSLWLELKTQAFIATVVKSDPRPPAMTLSNLFNVDRVRQQLLDIRAPTPGHPPSEEEFLGNMQSRRTLLEADLARDAARILPQKYGWDDFLGEATSYIKILKVDDGILTGSERLLLKPRQPVDQSQSDRSSLGGTGANGEEPSPNIPPGFLDTAQETFAQILLRCAVKAVHSVGVPYIAPGQPPYPLIPFSDQDPSDQPAVLGRSASPAAKMETNEIASAETDVPHESQTAPTLILYERARTATETEALHPPQPAGGERARGEIRPWSLEEENALLQSLDRFRGPQWAQILTDEQLKDRDQVQLKDKARSLKLFFLKAGVEVPFYLKEATRDPRSVPVGATIMKQEERKPALAGSVKTEPQTEQRLDEILA